MRIFFVFLYKKWVCSVTNNLLAFSSKTADVAAASTDKRSVTLLTTYNTRFVHAVTHRAQQNLKDFTAIASKLLKTWTTTYRAATSQQFSHNLLAIASARNVCCVGF